MDNKFTEEQLLEMLSKKIDVDYDISMDKKFEDDLFKELSGVEGLLDYFKSTRELDIKRYFNAIDERDRNMIKGHFSFANYLIGKIKEANKKK